MTNAHDDSDPPVIVPQEPSVSVREKRFEVIATVLLSVAVLATAWAGYQASLWDGIQSSNYTQAASARTKAAQLRTEANQFRLADLSVFESFVEATVSGDEELAAFYRDRFRPEFETGFDAWIALDPLVDPSAPASPFEMAEYQLTQEQAATELERRADALFLDGEEANSVSDVYTLATLLLAVVLFFAAISERFDYLRVRVVLLVFAAAGLVAGIVVAIGQPISSG